MNKVTEAFVEAVLANNDDMPEDKQQLVDKIVDLLIQNDWSVKAVVQPIPSIIAQRTVNDQEFEFRIRPYDFLMDGIMPFTDGDIPCDITCGHYMLDYYRFDKAEEMITYPEEVLDEKVSADLAEFGRRQREYENSL